MNRNRWAALAASVLLVAIVAVTIIRQLGGSHVVPVPQCQAVGGGVAYAIDTDQAENASTIADVARERRLPNHAVTVALAAALQESNLHNISYGDRDSLGLFQQRPSMGWGTPEQLTTPTYAAAAFYRELERVANWERLDVTVAAQRVQRSGAPSAYAKWEGESRALAAALTGEVPAAFSCQFVLDPKPGPAPSFGAALRADLGVVNLSESRRPADDWMVASWLVAHAPRYRIVTVSAQGQRWDASSGKWRASTARADRVVRVVQASPKGT